MGNFWKMKNKRIFAETYAKSHNYHTENGGIFCAQTDGVYCIYTYQHRLLSFIVTTVFRYLVGLLAERKTAVFFHIPILYDLCQESKVSGPQRTTVPAILRQQRDSLHHATLQATSRSKGWTAHATLSSSQSPSISTNSSLVPNGSVSSTSATGGSSSPSKPPE